MVGCGMEEPQRKCERSDDLDLQKVLEYAVGFERTNLIMSKIRGQGVQGPSGRGVVAYAASSKGSSIRDTQNRNASVNDRACGYCGGKPHAEKANCHAMDKKCAKCEKMNHFGRVCRSSVVQTSEKQSSGKFAKKGTQFYTFSFLLSLT